ncbi:hypothetical protein GCM10023258_25990 [Terrabacter aeriphilus]|uniref:Uncharacterized protein n=1 Tax=Terrabacter aeriphilus TaxID=515662 RepID=A0ABP9JEH3_9MICO
MTSTTSTPPPARAGEDHDDGTAGGTGQGSARGAGLWSTPWVAPLAAALGWFVGLLPWLVRRANEGTFGTPWNPRNDLRDALLPYAPQLLPLLVLVAATAGVLAGSAPWTTTDRRSRRLLLAALSTLGALVAAGWSVAQTLAPDPDLGGSGSTVDRVRLAFVALTAVAALVGLALGLLVSLGGSALRAVAAAPVAVLAADWLGQLVLGTGRVATPTWLPTVLAVLAGAGTGLALAAAGSAPPLARVVAWALAPALLVATPAALTAARYVLESLPRTPTRTEAVAELVHDGLQVLGGSFRTTLTAWGPPPATPLLAVVVAIVIAIVVATVRRATGRSTGRAPGDGPDDPAYGPGRRDGGHPGEG